MTYHPAHPAKFCSSCLFEPDKRFHGNDLKCLTLTYGHALNGTDADSADRYRS
ncbi:hypothetical protein SAMN05421644_1377 [Allochromatium warmingii]|uniref:Uncharacterized protein n=1 Tax=Allochromatium warmingii TaxID=61595 RepID=A0A1H3HV22_ALLWA|nr:hypothetical protein SAMN05421644_1377 [Allochromatium warmingii]